MNGAPPSADGLTGTGRSAPPALGRLDGRVLIVAAVVFTVLMALSGRYGFHRDELYFLDCARHLQASYVDQPVLTPLLARISLSLFGVSLPGLRLWPSLFAAGTVLVGGATARELGGGRTAQLLAGVATATMPALLGAAHLMGPTSFDVLAWASLALVVLRVERTQDPRWWPVAGLVLGLGLANKHSVGFFAMAVLAGALVSGGRRLVLNRWFALGAVLAACFTMPDLWWQAAHQWATIAMTRRLNAENGGVGHVPTWLVGQLIMTAVALVPLWVAGLRGLWLSGRPLSRALVWAYGLLFFFFMATSGAKIYYLAGAYVYLLAAGAVGIEARLVVNSGQLRSMLSRTALTAAVAVPIVLPVLPASDIGWSYGINQVLGESLGWPELVATVRKAWLSVPAAERGRTVILTTDYGEEGAINELGRGSDLPLAVGDHNADWWWGPGNPRATTVLVVAPGPRDLTDYGSYLGRFFGSVRTVAILGNSQGLHNQEWGGHVYLCSELHRSWGSAWPALRHYD